MGSVVCLRECVCVMTFAYEMNIIIDAQREKRNTGKGICKELLFLNKKYNKCCCLKN